MADATRLPRDDWDRSLAAQYAVLPIPRLAWTLWLVLAPGSRRIHCVATVSEVVRMLMPTWPHTEDRWTAVRTVCGRSGPFGSPRGRRSFGFDGRQFCRKCGQTDGAWDGYGVGMGGSA